VRWLCSVIKRPIHCRGALRLPNKVTEPQKRSSLCQDCGRALPRNILGLRLSRCSIANPPGAVTHRQARVLEEVTFAKDEDIDGFERLDRDMLLWANIANYRQVCPGRLFTRGHTCIGVTMKVLIDRAGPVFDYMVLADLLAETSVLSSAISWSCSFMPFVCCDIS